MECNSFYDCFNKQGTLFLIYVAGFLLYLLLSIYIFSRYQKMNLLYYSVIAITGVVFLINGYLSMKDIVNTYSEELELYAYVEKNASTLVALSIAIAILIGGPGIGDGRKIDIRVLACLTISFISSALVLVNFWTERGNAKMIRYVRDVKTCLLIIAVSFAVIGFLMSYTNRL